MREMRLLVAAVLLLLCWSTSLSAAEEEELQGGVVTGTQRLERGPYLVRGDLVVAEKGHLVLGPGVTLRFYPRTGITVHGILSAQGTAERKVVLTTAEDVVRPLPRAPLRLVDGPSPLAGRLQVLHNQKWRSLCTNSRNWTLTDVDVACRQMGFDGGRWWAWLDRQPGLPQPRLLLEAPNCGPAHDALQNCPNWPSRQMGAGVCDYHPDLGLECLGRVSGGRAAQHWRGVSFEGARHQRVLAHGNTLYASVSLSELRHTELRHAGVAADGALVAALQVAGVPPKMHALTVTNAAFHGLNVTRPQAPVAITDSTFANNAGFGVYVNSSTGLVHMVGSVVTGNGADGVRYVHHDEVPDRKVIDGADVFDFCTFPITNSQTFPIPIFAEQGKYNPVDKDCNKYFFTKEGQVLTLRFLSVETERNESATVEVFDGTSAADRLLARYVVRNGTFAQSVTSTRNNVFIRFKAQPRTHTLVYMQLISGHKKSFDLNLTECVVVDNNGRGVGVENLRSGVHVHNSSVSSNGHVAGVHVASGVGDVNVTDSRVAFNVGDGVNVTHSGGSVNVTRCVVSSNQGHGVAVHLNETEGLVAFVHEAIVTHSVLFRNLEAAVLVGNFCTPALVNVSANWFNDSARVALDIRTCWRPLHKSHFVTLQVGHNKFASNRLGLRMAPAVNVRGKIEHNWFAQHTFGALQIHNGPWEELEVLPTELLVQANEFSENSGVFVVQLGLSPYGEAQHLLFTRNFVRDNAVAEPFESLAPRSRVAAAVVVASANVHVFRNILQNHASEYEIGSRLLDQSQTINCTYNWLGYANERTIYDRLFHRKDRFDLAQIEYIPYLLHSSNPSANTIISQPTFVAAFSEEGEVGGEVDGQETLRAGEYLVTRDVSVRVGGRLTLQAGVTLRFRPSVGIMVAGKLEARGRAPNDILLTLEREEPLNDTSAVPVRLLGGRTDREGRLQLKVNETWGTVCNYNWNMRAAEVACHQLGLVLNPDDWFLERADMPEAGTAEPIVLANVQCLEDDLDVTACRAEGLADFENSCSHENDVGLRCYLPSWAGMRFGVLAERSDLQFITIEKAGLLDYSTSRFKPALQMDLARHALHSVRVVDNMHDGLGVVYSDLYSADAANTVTDSEFSGNAGSGVSLRQLGLTLSGCTVERNAAAGVAHDPELPHKQQRELAGWFKPPKDNAYTPYRPIVLPESAEEIVLQNEESKYVMTSRVAGGAEKGVRVHVRCTPGYVVGVQLLNPIHNRSTETLLVVDAPMDRADAHAWDLRRDLSVFPTASSSYGVVLDYKSGADALGGAVLLLSAIVAPTQNVPNRIVRGKVPTLEVRNSKIRHNRKGVAARFYNRYLNDVGDLYLRKANQTIKLLNCDISHNLEEAIFVYAPHWDVHSSNISEIKFMINGSLITDNGRGITQFSRDLRSSNNLFHWVLQDNTVERNAGGGFHVSLPYVWQYDENFTHSLFLDNNTFRNNRDFRFVVDGHFAHFNLTNNRFVDNACKSGLVSVRGMEKQMRLEANEIRNNVGKFMVEFRVDSQSEILGEVDALFRFNRVQGNRAGLSRRLQKFTDPTFTLGFNGIQKVKVNRNLFGDNQLDYELLAGIKTAKIDNKVNVAENWWGTAELGKIKERIFDFDDWNNHAVAEFRPYLLENDHQGSLSSPWEAPTAAAALADHLGGRLTKSITLSFRTRPYLVKSDVTVMPGVTLTIAPGCVLEFAPNVGILVLGVLRAQGRRDQEIVMRPQTPSQGEQAAREAKEYFVARPSDSIRLCTGPSCAGNASEGFLEYFNRTTLQWVPVCDSRFTERNAEVVCRELGFDPLNVHSHHGPRVEFHSNSLTRIWSWPEPLQCSGDEPRLEDCPVRLNGQLYGHRHECAWNSEFVFIHCGRRNLQPGLNYWGGVRFAFPDFEYNLYEHRIHDSVTHETTKKEESVLEFVNITGAGVLHGEKAPAVQSIVRSPRLSHLNLNQSASHGISLVSPTETMRMRFMRIVDSLGVGMSVVSLTGEGRESAESSFAPLKEVPLSYGLFSMIDMCDSQKEVVIEERVLLYYKYDNNPVNCVKILTSVYRAKPFGFRLLQFNLFNSTGKPGRPDSISLFDGDIYNVSTTLLAEITVGGANEKRLFRTRGPSLSVKVFANGASAVHGFVAEVVTLPISAIGFDRDTQHNVSYSVFRDNRQGALHYATAGEVNPVVTLEWSQFDRNCLKLYGNFTTCKAAVAIDVQNTQNVYFRNNLVRFNQGGLSIRADSRGSATSLKGFVHNNLFADNENRPTIYVEGRQSSPYQEVTIYRNYFTRSSVPYDNVIILKQVVSNFTFNYLHNNLGRHILEVSGFEKVRLPIYQTTSHNGFYENYAIDLESRGTIIAGTAGQHYVDNILLNPANDYEIVTVNRSLSLDVWKTPIDAQHNWWGYNNSLAVMSRIKDRRDDLDLLEVDFEPFHMSNRTILSGKCPPGWTLVADTCYIYIGAPMTFAEAKDFCRSDNATMPYVMGNYYALYQFLRHQQQHYMYYDRVWVQHLNRINRCTAFTYQTIEEDHCDQLLPFLCEIDPKVFIDPYAWTQDVVAMAVVGSIGLLLVLVLLIAALWYTKSKRRHVERLERRNSIRASMHSLRSINSSHGFAELGYRRAAAQARSTSTLATNVREYKRMNGSVDSMDKSQLNESSVEGADTHSYDIYEAHNPHAFNVYAEEGKQAPFPSTQGGPSAFDLAFRNEGFKDNSTFASRDPLHPSVSYRASPSDYDDSTLPCGGRSFYPEQNRELDETVSEFQSELRGESYTPSTLPDPPFYPSHSSPDPYYYNGHDDFPERPKSHVLLETDLDSQAAPSMAPPLAPPRSKSEALLETTFDFQPLQPATQGDFLSRAARSKSQPLETAM
ncbi:protein bark beetle isoform X2 [Neocloeon triangulifer]|uniref:protein bark beetle isoform X2 n=1 Tax=Neocloeon triangulifer TaxID=2078957 RepID=UPI00286F8E6C|nr:protein bark beetle isoform X2 [Neocloeon triangulifer]